MNATFRPAGNAENELIYFMPLPTPFSPIGVLFVPKTAQVSIGEDKPYPNTSYCLLQAENAKKQDFFAILEFKYGNLSGLW